MTNFLIFLFLAPCFIGWILIIYDFARQIHFDYKRRKLAKAKGFELADSSMLIRCNEVTDALNIMKAEISICIDQMNELKKEVNKNDVKEN